MDKITSLNLSFDRIFVQLILPGLIAMFPGYLFLKEIEPTYIYNAIKAITPTDGIAMIIFSFILGMIIENIGSRIEVYYIGERQKKKYGNDYLQTWSKYLQLSFENEPIGQRYLRTILFRMKFELSFAIALLIGGVSLIFYFKK